MGLLLGGGLLSFVVGVCGFGSMESRGTALALGLFLSIFIGGVVITFLVIDALKSRNAVGPAADKKSGKILVYPVLMFVALLPIVMVKLGPNVGPDQLGQAIGRLVGTCFIPAIVTGIWINRSRKQWSWPGAALRYFVFFVVLAAVSSYGSRPR